ncbi:MAG: metallophosphoesterase [Bacteroidales bacterium]
MRIAIITDIHEDFEMLEKALDALKTSGYDILACLGDITGFAPEFYNHTPDANACIDLLREFADIVLAGNHDLFSAQRLPTYHLEKNIPLNWYEFTLNERYALSNNTLWLYEKEVKPNLSPENEAFLARLHETKVIDNSHSQIMLSHFLQPDLAGVSRWFPYRVGELRPHFRLMKECETNLAFVGHCHPQGPTILSKLFWSAPNYKKTKVSRKTRIVLCPAIVRNAKPSAAIIFDTSTYELRPIFIKPD